MRAGDTRDTPAARRLEGGTASKPLHALLGIKDLHIEEHRPLAPLTTWGVGGPARFLATARTAAAAARALEVASDGALPVVALGNGSNTLFADSGYPGLVLRFAGELSSLGVEGSRLRAGAGARLGAMAKAARDAALSGLEFASGIPGTAGGAVMTNAGAFGSCTGDIIEAALAAGGNGRVLAIEVFDCDYRRPLVDAGLVILEAVLQLREAELAEIDRRMSEFSDRRKRTQPVGQATAGSVFANPADGSAGRMIEECGLKGRAVGGAKISEKHANFIINSAGATAADIRALMELAAREVRERFGVELRPEVRSYGFEEE